MIIRYIILKIRNGQMKSSKQSCKVCNIDSTCDVDKLIDDFKKDGKYDNQFLDNLKSIDWGSEMATISIALRMTA